MTFFLTGCGSVASSPLSAGSTSSIAPETSTPGTGTATVTWVAPTTNSDGTPLSNLAGYTIYYGVTASSLTQAVLVENPASVSYVFTNLSSGTWYFAVSAYTNTDLQGALSPVVSKQL